MSAFKGFNAEELELLITGLRVSRRHLYDSRVRNIANVLLTEALWQQRCMNRRPDITAPIRSQLEVSHG